MKITSLCRSLIPLGSLCAAVNAASAQGTAFTYQGRLSENGSAANGLYDLRFRLSADALGNTLISSNAFFDDLPISNGLFTVTLDFGAALLDGSDRWLDIAVRAGESAGAYTTLTPLQPLTAIPYAIRAATAAAAGSASAVTGPIPDSLLSSNVALLRSSPAFTGLVAAAGVTIGTNTSGAAVHVGGGTNFVSAAAPRLMNVITNGSTTVGVSNMTAPVNVFLEGNRAYVSSYFPGALEIFDVSNPGQPSLLGEALDHAINPASPFARLGGASGGPATGRPGTQVPLLAQAEEHPDHGPGRARSGRRLGVGLRVIPDLRHTRGQRHRAYS